MTVCTKPEYCFNNLPLIILSTDGLIFEFFVKLEKIQNQKIVTYSAIQ